MFGWYFLLGIVIVAGVGSLAGIAMRHFQSGVGRGMGYKNLDDLGLREEKKKDILNL